MDNIKAYIIRENSSEIKRINLFISEMTEDEKKIVMAGSLINYNRKIK